MAKLESFENGQGPLKARPLAINENGSFIQKGTNRLFKAHGINVGSNSKLPAKPIQKTYYHPDKCGFYTEADYVSFVGRPFPLNEAQEHIVRLKKCGYNTIRFLFTWEAIEHEGPGIYDVEYAEYVVELLKIIDEIGGIYVFLNPHQDVWSRFTGGSGAPIWTLYAAGLDPTKFKDTLAAKLHNDSDDPANFTKMVWATNYYRLASLVMFTMFYSGSEFLPKAKIDGVNIENYLQEHFINSVTFLIGFIKNKIPNIFQTCLLGVESLNEPSPGLYGFSNLNVHSHDVELKLDEMPTPIQAMRLGMGMTQRVSQYYISIFGPSRKNLVKIDPKGTKAWIDKNNNKDRHYGFNRSSEWELGECIFAQHGIWNSKTGELLKSNYFGIHPNPDKKSGFHFFNNGPFLRFWQRYKTAIRKIDSDMFLIMQPPVLQIPPNIKDSEFVDSKTILALHYYDGLSLMFKTWNRFVNVDTLGILRGRYFNPAFSIVFGESNIRKLIRSELKEMYMESRKNVGDIPVIFTETGMPFDMDNKRAYKTGNYRSQESANDAILWGLQSERLNFTYWCYNPDNCHKWGDQWNLEDFSIWSRDDDSGSNSNSNSNSTVPSNESSASIESDDGKDMTSKLRRIFSSETLPLHRPRKYNYFSNFSKGVRSPKAIIRPNIVLAKGEVITFFFDIHTSEFYFEMKLDRRFNRIMKDDGFNNASAVNNNSDVFQDVVESSGTIIMIPELHYSENSFDIEVNYGQFVVKKDDLVQWVEWDLPLDIEDGTIATFKIKPHGLPSTPWYLKAIACG
ncbi:hydrolase [Martiniozyma asiatica (nom. inval.)]|nr:hydrolase [Martiniozyma asiatica]